MFFYPILFFSRIGFSIESVKLKHCRLGFVTPRRGAQETVIILWSSAQPTGIWITIAPYGNQPRRYRDITQWRLCGECVRLSVCAPVVLLCAWYITVEESIEEWYRKKVVYKKKKRCVSLGLRLRYGREKWEIPSCHKLRTHPAGNSRHVTVSRCGPFLGSMASQSFVIVFK